MYVGVSRLGVAFVAASLVAWSPHTAIAQFQAEDEVSPQIWVDYNPANCPTSGFADEEGAPATIVTGTP